MSDEALLAQAAARIRELEADLAAARAAAADKAASDPALADEQSAHEITLKERDQLQAELDELKGLLGDPPEGSGIEIVHYLDPADGATVARKRYRAEDGAKFKLLPDALQYQAALSLAKDLGITIEQAKAIVAKRDTVRGNLALADGRATA